MSQDAQRRALETVVDLVGDARISARAALQEARQDESLLDLGVAYVEHIERSLREAMNSLDGARFTTEALLAKLPASGATAQTQEN